MKTKCKCPGKSDFGERGYAHCCYFWEFFLYFWKFFLKWVDETGKQRYNVLNLTQEGCEEKSKRTPAVQRVPAGCEGIRKDPLKMVSELRRRQVVCDGCARYRAEYVCTL